MLPFAPHACLPLRLAGRLLSSRTNAPTVTQITSGYLPLGLSPLAPLTLLLGQGSPLFRFSSLINEVPHPVSPPQPLLGVKDGSKHAAEGAPHDRPILPAQCCSRITPREEAETLSIPSISLWISWSQAGSCRAELSSGGRSCRAEPSHSSSSQGASSGQCCLQLWQGQSGRTCCI